MRNCNPPTIGIRLRRPQRGDLLNPMRGDIQNQIAVVYLAERRGRYGRIFSLFKFVPKVLIGI